MAPWTSLSVLPQLFSSLLAGYGGAHLATLPGAPARPALGPPTARVHMSPRSHHHPAEDVNVSPLRRNQKAGIFWRPAEGKYLPVIQPWEAKSTGTLLAGPELGHTAWQQDQIDWMYTWEVPGNSGWVALVAAGSRNVSWALGVLLCGGALQRAAWGHPGRSATAAFPQRPEGGSTSRSLLMTAEHPAPLKAVHAFSEAAASTPERRRWSSRVCLSLSPPLPCRVKYQESRCYSSLCLLPRLISSLPVP